MYLYTHASAHTYTHTHTHTKHAHTHTQHTHTQHTGIATAVSVPDINENILYSAYSSETTDAFTLWIAWRRTKIWWQWYISVLQTGHSASCTHQWCYRLSGKRTDWSDFQDARGWCPFEELWKEVCQGWQSEMSGESSCCMWDCWLCGVNTLWPGPIVSQSHCVPILLCSSPVVFQSLCVPTMLCSSPFVSQSHCVPTVLCPGPLVSQSHCVPTMLCSSPIVSQSCCVPTMLCSCTLVFQSHCVTTPLCPSHAVSQFPCVQVPLCPSTHSVHSVLVPKRHSVCCIMVPGLGFTIHIGTGYTWNWDAVGLVHIWTKFGFLSPGRTGLACYRLGHTGTGPECVQSLSQSLEFWCFYAL